MCSRAIDSYLNLVCVCLHCEGDKDGLSVGSFVQCCDCHDVLCILVTVYKTWPPLHQPALLALYGTDVVWT